MLATQESFYELPLAGATLYELDSRPYLVRTTLSIEPCLTRISEDYPEREDSSYFVQVSALWK